MSLQLNFILSTNFDCILNQHVYDPLLLTQGVLIHHNYQDVIDPQVFFKTFWSITCLKLHYIWSIPFDFIQMNILHNNQHRKDHPVSIQDFWSNDEFRIVRQCNTVRNCMTMPYHFKLHDSVIPFRIVWQCNIISNKMTM